MKYEIKGVWFESCALRHEGIYDPDRRQRAVAAQIAYDWAIAARKAGLLSIEPQIGYYDEGSEALTICWPVWKRTSDGIGRRRAGQEWLLPSRDASALIDKMLAFEQSPMGQENKRAGLAALPGPEAERPVAVLA